jgi:hypothetical protein
MRLPLATPNEKEEVNMQRRLTWLVLLSAAIVATTGSALATDPVGFTSTTLALGRAGSFEASSYFIHDKDKLWLSFQKTLGKSDMYVVNNVWQPGGSTGWHTHPSYTLVIVTAGTVTQYQANDPACTPHVYTTGMTFIDHGGSHVHIVRNEGTVEAQVIAVRLIPAGQAGRIDSPDPGNCHF